MPQDDASWYTAHAVCLLRENHAMWRSLFLASGIFLMILGMECLGVESVRLKLREPPPAPVSPFDSPPDQGAMRVITPPPWVPWSLLSCGAVVCLYSFTIPRRVAGN